MLMSIGFDMYSKRIFGQPQMLCIGLFKRILFDSSAVNAWQIGT